MKKNNGWPRLLREQPQLALYCDTYGGWDTFDGDAWALLLEKQPHFSEKCTLLDAWKRFGSSNWVALLTKQPQFASICEANNAWRYFKAEDWQALLTARPEFEDCCDKHNGWSSFHVRQWVLLLRSQPDFSEKCNSRGMWLYFDGYDWVELLRGQPFFTAQSDKFDGWGKIAKIGRWCELLEVCPQFANKCDEYNGWSDFDGFDWWRLLRTQPQFIEKCNEENGWERIYRYFPSQHFVYRPYDYRYNEVPGYFVNDFDPTSYKYPEEYVETFGRNEYWNRAGCGCWEESMLNAVGYTLDSDGQLNCVTNKSTNTLARVNKTFWIYTLLRIISDKGFSSNLLASFVRQFTGAWNWSTLSRDEWKQILCDGDYSLLNFLAPIGGEQFWCALENSWPTWFNDATEMRWNARDKDDGTRQGKQKIAKHAAEFSAWPELLIYHPEYAFACKNVKGWHLFDQDDWQRLLMEGSFLDTVERQVLNADFWISLLVTAPQYGETCDALNGWPTLSAADWYWLLTMHPQFANRCNSWEQFEGWQWVKLLKKEASLSAYCDLSDGWTKFGEEDWLSLLLSNKSFSKKCEESAALAKFGWKSVDEAIANEQKRLSRRYDHVDDPLDSAPDWREESGWNDMYGDADPSDFIEFR